MTDQPIPESFDDLPRDASQLHEACVALFGREVFAARNAVLLGCQRCCESEGARTHLAKLFRQPYDDMAALPCEARLVAYRFAQDVADRIIVNLLRTLGHQGYDQPLGPDHAMQFRLDLEIVDTRSDELALRETINRKGERSFGNYWGRWLNTFGNLGDAKKD